MSKHESFVCDWCKLDTAQTHQYPFEWLHVEQPNGNGSFDFCSLRCLILWGERWEHAENPDKSQFLRDDRGGYTLLSGDDKSKTKRQLEVRSVSADMQSQ